MPNKSRKQTYEVKHVPKSAQANETADSSSGPETSVEFPAAARSSSWHPNLYEYSEKCSIQFRSEEDMDWFIDLIWEEKDLQGMPHIPAGENTIIIPQAAEKIVSDKLSRKSRVTINRVLDPKSLPPSEFALLKKERNI